MGDKTAIEWTDATWNPIVGCSIVSPGCTNCYAMKWANQRLDGSIYSPQYSRTTKKVNGTAVWTGKVAIAPDHIVTAPLRWKKPRRIFVNSMGDLFHESVPDEWIDKVFAVMALAPQHTFQVLTKRSMRTREYVIPALAHRIGMAAFEMVLNDHVSNPKSQLGSGVVLRGDIPHLQAWPLPNVWLGVSAEDQARADERIPDLLATPAAVRFVSAEPLLGPVDFENIDIVPWLDSFRKTPRPDPDSPNWPAIKYDVLRGHVKGPDDINQTKLDWIIVGGESGKYARPMHPDWVRSIRDQCAAAGVPFFFKQMDKKQTIPPDLMIREFPDAR